MTNEIATLRGQRDVLCRLLSEASEMLDALPIDGTADSVMRETLLREIALALLDIATEKMESTHV